jgi:hypothetical protein
MPPCVLPLPLRRTSLDTSELKVVKLFHLSGSPGSWTLYNILNFAYPLLPHFKVLVYRNLHVGDHSMSKTFPAKSRLSLASSITDAMMNYSESYCFLRTLRLLNVAILTIIFCQFAHLYNLTGFTLYKAIETRSIKSERILLTTEAVQMDSLMGRRAAGPGGHGVPVPRAKPWGR